MEVEVRLNTNESPEPPPAELAAELASTASGLSLNRYPDRRAATLTAAVAAHHGVAPEQVFCANGSNEVLQCLLLAYGGAGRRALVFEPTYALHAHIARLTGTEVLAGARTAAFEVERAAAVELIAAAGPEVVLLCSPNNPTGNAESLDTIASIAAATDGLVVVDEAYAQFAPSSALELLAETPNLAVVRTFSKTWALAGLRLGYLLADPEVAAACAKVALPYHLDAFKQEAGVLALRHEAEMDARIRRLVEARHRLVEGLSRLRVDLWPSAANFVLFRPRHVRAAEVWGGLVERSVLVRDVSSFPGLEDCLRVTVGTAEENRRFLAALGEVLEDGPR